MQPLPKSQVEILVDIIQGNTEIILTSHQTNLLGKADINLFPPLLECLNRQIVNPSLSDQDDISCRLDGILHITEHKKIDAKRSNFLRLQESKLNDKIREFQIQNPEGPTPFTLARLANAVYTVRSRTGLYLNFEDDLILLKNICPDTFYEMAIISIKSGVTISPELITSPILEIISPELRDR